MTTQQVAQVDRAVESFLMQAFGPTTGTEIYNIGASISTEEARATFFKMVVKDVVALNTGKAKDLSNVRSIAEQKFTPVDPKTFLDDVFYLGMKADAYPVVRDSFIEMNSGDYSEVVLTGAIGTAKTTLALWTTAYQLYLLSSYRSPQRLFGLDRASEIVFVFQSVTLKTAVEVNYGRFKELVTKSPYFKKYFPHNRDVESELRFPNRIMVKPISGSDTAAIGQNVFSGVVDEINYMAHVENSKMSSDGTGTYDQAVAVYNSIARRRESRFMQQGKLPGVLCLVSSRKYPGQFTDRKELEAKTNPTIYVYDKRVWDIKPDSFSGETFPVFIGDDGRKPRVMDPEDIRHMKPEDAHLIMSVPVEYRTKFEGDITNSLREIAGVSTLASHPFIMDTEKITEAAGKAVSILSLDATDFVTSTLKAYPKRIINPEALRFAHIDLALTGDSAGVAIGHVPGFTQIHRGGDSYEILPEIHIDCLLEVRAPRGGEIEFHRIRKLLYTLQSLGLPIRWVSFDTYQSYDSMQVLRNKGFKTGPVSIDTSTVPYSLTKAALYDGRLALPDHAKCRKELASLEFDPKKDRIDHPPNGSKDVSDALAGVVYGLITRREIWATHGITTERIPLSVLAAVSKAKALKESQNPDGESE